MLKVRFHSERAERGATAIEYALMASLIAVAIVVAVTAVGINLDTLFSDPELHNALQT